MKQLLIFILVAGLGGMLMAQNQEPLKHGRHEHNQHQNADTHGQQVSIVAQTTEVGIEKGQVVRETARMRRQDRRQIREQRRLDARERLQQRKEMARERRGNRRQHDSLNENPGHRPDNAARPQGVQMQGPQRQGRGHGGGRPK